MAQVSLRDASVTSDSPGILVKGVVDPRQAFSGNTVVIIEGRASVDRQINDQIDSTYIENGETAYWLYFELSANGSMSLQLSNARNISSIHPGPSFTATALANLYVVVFYGSTSAKWDGSKLDLSLIHI